MYENINNENEGLVQHELATQSGTKARLRVNYQKG